MVVSAATQYNPSVHITARQLRRLGFYLSEMIPDRAFVRRIAVGLFPEEQWNDGSPTVALEVLEAFQAEEEDCAYRVAS